MTETPREHHHWWRRPEAAGRRADALFRAAGKTPILPNMTDKELAHQHAVYTHGSRPLTLMYSPTSTAAWEVYYGGDYLGLVEERHPAGARRLEFVARLPGEEDTGDGIRTVDWRAAVDVLAGRAGL